MHMQAERLDDGTFVISCRMASTAEDVGATLAGLSDLLLAQVPDLSNESDWELVIAEVLNNIVEHAYSDRPDGRIDMTLRFNAGHLLLEFIDSGLPMPRGTPPEGHHVDLDVARNDLPEGGFGWFLIRSLSDSLTYRREGGKNHLTLTIPLSRGQHT